MKTFSAPPKLANNRPPTAKACLLANVLILPGAGSLMRSRKEGYFQVAAGILGLLISGFATVRLVQIMGKIPIAPVDSETVVRLIHEAGPEMVWAGAGLAVFGFGWVWSLFSSLAIFREERSGQTSTGE